MAIAKQMIEQYFTSNGIKFQSVNDEIIKLSFGMDNGDCVIFIEVSGDEYATIHAFDFVKVPAGKIENMYKVVNKLNDTYRFVKFTIDEERGTIEARAYAIIQPDSCGPEVYELVGRTTNIVDDAIPELNKVIWA